MAKGDPFVTLDEYKLFSQNAPPSTVLDATLTADIAYVTGLIQEKIKQPVWTDTYLQYYDAPPTYQLTLRQWPVWPSTLDTPIIVMVAPYSNGDPARFTSTTLLQPYVDYILKDDQPDGKSRSAILQRITQPWGYRWQFDLGLTTSKLTPKITPNWKSVQVTYTAGYDEIPSGIKTATLLATSKLFQMRTRGILQTSEGLSSSSWAVAGGAAIGLLDDPLIFDCLRAYQDVYTASAE